MMSTDKVQQTDILQAILTANAQKKGARQQAPEESLPQDTMWASIPD